MTIRQYKHLMGNLTEDEITHLNHYNTLILSTIHDELRKKNLELDVLDNINSDLIKYHVADIVYKLIDKI